MTNVLPHPRSIGGAIVAGAVGGILIVACIAGMDALALHTPGFSLVALFAFDASILVGKAAYTSDAYVALGVALHFLVAIGWAVGYAYVAERQPQLWTRPYISGAFFGVIVYFAMQLVIVAADLYRLPTPSSLGVALLAHCAFYGIPVALITGRLHPTR